MNEKDIQPPQRLPQRDVLERINFLSEASKLASMDPDLIGLSQYLGTEMDYTAKKSKVRIKPKQTFCKKCKTPMISPISSDTFIRGNFIYYKCKLCGNVTKKYKEMERTSNDKTEHWIFHQEYKNGKLEIIDNQN